MKEALRLLIALTLISSGAGLLLAYTNKVTAGPIAAQREAETIRALQAVLPAFDNNPAACTNLLVDNGNTWTFHVAREAGQYAGAAFATSSRKGYGGEIVVMVGVNANDTVNRIHILSQHETPGLGTKVADTAFKAQFGGKPVEGTVWAVRKDKGGFDAVTGATISSRAVLEAVRNGLAVYQKHKAEIMRTGE